MELPHHPLLASLGAALVGARRVEAQHGKTLDHYPRCFGLRPGAVRYVGEVAMGERRAVATRGAPWSMR